MERYQGKKAVIIGGTSGMGLATAKMLLDGGARVLVTGLSKAGLESAQKEIGKQAIVVSSDARSLTDIDALASRVKSEFDTFDLLSVSAGISIPTPVEQGMKRGSVGLGAGSQKRRALLVREKPRASARFLLAADVADRITVDQPALLHGEGEHMRERRDVASRPPRKLLILKVIWWAV
jgi:hypothetical protein